MQKISKDQTTKTAYKKDANFLYGLDSDTYLFGSKTFDGTWITIGLIGLLAIFAVIMVISKGISGISANINQKLGDMGVISGIIILIIAALIIVPISLRRRRRIFNKEMSMRKQTGLSKDMNYGMTNDYAMKFYSEGVQLNEYFFQWNEVSKFFSKGIVRVRYLKDTAIFAKYTRDAFECYYFVGLQDTNNKIHTAKFHEHRFRQANNPTKILRKILKKLNKLELLEEKGIEWVKGDIAEPKIKEKLTNPFGLTR